MADVGSPQYERVEPLRPLSIAQEVLIRSPSHSSNIIMRGGDFKRQYIFAGLSTRAEPLRLFERFPIWHPHPHKRRLSRLRSDNRLFGVPAGKMSDR
jgi:hypothetical protein